MWHFRNHEESNSYRHCGSRHGHFRGHFGRFGYGRGQGDGGGFSRRRGLYDSDELRLVLLYLIAEKPRHGYDLIKEIEERSGGVYAPSPGVIYPTLTMLEELGHVTTSAGDGAKKLHTITPEGRAYLAAYRPTVEALLARMQEANRIHGGGTAPQVLRAMENLKLALRLRLSRGPLSEEQINAAAAAIDAAAVSVERI